MTRMLSLSMGTTTLAGPSCKAGSSTQPGAAGGKARQDKKQEGLPADLPDLLLGALLPAP